MKKKIMLYSLLAIIILSIPVLASLGVIQAATWHSNTPQISHYIATDIPNMKENLDYLYQRDNNTIYLHLDYSDNLTQAYRVDCPAGSCTHPHLIIEDNVTIADNATIGKGWSTTLLPGRNVTIQDNISIIFGENATFQAQPDRQIFYGNGRVVFGNHSLPRIETIWFPGNSLTKAYASATNDVEIHVTGYAYLTETLEMNKRGVVIKCPGMYSYTAIYPTDAQTGALFFLGDNVTTSNSYGQGIDGCQISGNLYGERTGHATVGVRVRGGMEAFLTNNHFQYIAGPAIEFDGNVTGTQVENVLIANNYIEGDPGYPSITKCISIVQGTNSNFTVGVLFDNNWCQYPTQYCLYAYQDPNINNSSMSINVNNLWCQGGIEPITGGGFVYASGNVDLNITGGFVETNSTYPGLYAANYANIDATNLAIGRRPMTDMTSRICLHNSTIYGDEAGYVYAKGHDFCVGRYTDDQLGFGPPNQPVITNDTTKLRARRYMKFNTGSSWKDGFGNEWQCTFGGQGADNSTWAPVNSEIVIPLDYTDFDNATTRFQKVSDGTDTAFVLFYAQTWGVLKSLVFVPTSIWDNNDTDENATLIQLSELGIDDKYMTRITKGDITPYILYTAYNSATDANSYLYNGAIVSMVPVTYGSESPDHLPILSNLAPHHIVAKSNAYSRNTKWTAGSGYVVLTYAAMAQRWWFNH